MAKRIRLSSNGSTWYTLPGNSGEFSNDAGQIDDTLFGQDFESQQSGLIDWSVSSNALYKGFAGYNGTILKQGTSTAMTAEAMSLISGKTYQITSSTKRNLNTAVAVTVLANAVAVSTSNILNIDYLFGRVTFIPAYTPTGPITITGAYYPLATLGCFNEYTLTMQSSVIDETCMDTARTNSGRRVNNYGLKTVSLEATGIHKTTNGWLAMLEARSQVLIEICPDGSNLAVARGLFKAVSQGQSGDVGATEEETVSFALSVPAIDLLDKPFKWMFNAGHTLNLAIVEAITAWETSDIIGVQYLPDGLTGWTGDVVVSDISLSAGLEAMAEFSVELAGSGAITAVT